MSAIQTSTGNKGVCGYRSDMVLNRNFVRQIMASITMENESNYQCHRCGKGFREMSDVCRHIKKCCMTPLSHVLVTFVTLINDCENIISWQTSQTN